MKLCSSSVYWLSNWQPSLPVMVSGQGRSGTTALVRALGAAGLPHYWEPGSAGAEELAMLRSWEKGEGNAIARLVESRQQVGQWVSKVPNAAIWAANRIGLARAWGGNWAIITRDPAAMASHDFAKGDLVDPATIGYRLHYRAAGYIQTIASAQRLAHSTGVVLISYEKLLSQPSEVLAELAQKMPLRDISAGAAEVRPQDPRYYSRI